MEFMLSLLCFFKNYKRAPSFRNAFIMLSLGCFSKKKHEFYKQSLENRHPYALLFFCQTPRPTTFSIKFFSYLSSYKSSLKLNFLFTLLLLLRIRIHDDGGVRLRFFVYKAALSSLFLICKIVVVVARSLF